MSNQEESNSIIRDFQNSLRKEKIFGHLRANQRKIIYSLVTIFVLLVVWNGIDVYKKIQAQKYSTILHKAFLDERNGDLEKSSAALEKIINDNSPAGVRQIAMLKYAASLANLGKENEAVEIYLQINKNKKFDPYFQEYAGLNAFKILINQEGKEDEVRSLAVKLEKNSKILTYYILEQKGFLEWKAKNFKIAQQIFENLAKNPEASADIKKRAADMVEIYNFKYAKQ